MGRITAQQTSIFSFSALIFLFCPNELVLDEKHSPSWFCNIFHSLWGKKQTMLWNSHSALNLTKIKNQRLFNPRYGFNYKTFLQLQFKILILAISNSYIWVYQYCRTAKWALSWLIQICPLLSHLSLSKKKRKVFTGHWLYPPNRLWFCVSSLQSI